MVFIRHGGKHIKAHSCRVQLVKEKSLKGSNEPHTVEKRKPTINDIEGKTYEDDSDDMEGDSDICNVPDSQSGPEQSQELSTEQVQDSNIETVQGDISNAESHQTEQARVEMPRKVIGKFSKGETMTFSLNGENYTVKILNRAGKAGGKYKNTFNVEYKAPSDMKDRKGYVDFDQVEDINIGNNDNQCCSRRLNRGGATCREFEVS